LRSEWLYVFLFVCLLVRSHILKNTCPNFTKIFCACCPGFWLCSSDVSAQHYGFVDLHIIEWTGPKQRRHTFPQVYQVAAPVRRQTTPFGRDRQGSGLGAKSTVGDCILCGCCRKSIRRSDIVIWSSFRHVLVNDFSPVGCAECRTSRPYVASVL